MAPRRKPVPNVPGLPLDTQNSHPGSNGSARPPSRLQSASPSLVRYSLTDPPLPPIPSEYDDYSQIEEFPQQYDAAPASVSPGTEPNYETAPLMDDHASISRQSDSSGATAVERDKGYGHVKMEELTPEKIPLETHTNEREPEFQSYQPGQYLPTIVTGETLQLDEYDPLPSQPTSNPFVDSHANTDTLTPNYAYYGEGQLPYEPLPLEQPLYGTPDYLQSRSHSTRSTHSHANALEPYNAMYTGLTGSLTSEHTGYVDHFHQDTEAYTSGSYNRSPYSQARSRSPTPAVDDEDYHVLGDGSVHYTGYDPEKGPALDGNSGSAQYAYANSQYSGEEKTPVSELPTPLETRHFGPAPAGRILRRHKTKKRVTLTKGNLVIKLPVPPKMVLPLGGTEETRETQYTAVTCDPDDFEDQHFGLRQNEMGRRTEVLVIITMYNEDEVLFCRTIYGVMRNIAYLCERKNSRIWGPDAWKKVVVCIVADGRKKIHPRVLDCLTLLGVYQPGGHMNNMVNNKQVTAHLFEYTTTFGLDEDLHFRYPEKMKGVIPTQIIFCLKERNERKINSHRWGFNAFSNMLQPNVCILLDIGTRPSKASIYRLWKAFDVNSNVAGACGEIATYKGKNWTGLLNPLVAAQNFEYKMSGILDKTTESMFGYISVLPGAFSAYRYIALQNDKDGKGPLASYFKGEVLHGRDTDIFTSNMYLAEDRILCFELVAKANSHWILKYVKGAVGETDVPEALPEFISQRRRWLNGSFFAATYAIAHAGQIIRSGHSMSRKVVLMIETMYNTINLIFSWFSLGNFYLFFVVLTSSLEDKSFGIPGIKYFNSVMQYLMASMVVACFLFSMGNKPQASKWKYKLTAIFFAVLMLYLIFCSVICMVRAASEGGGADRIMLLSLIVTYGIYVISSLLAFDPWHLLTSFLPYLLLSPTYINILNIYAFSNLDDISWGTKQDSIVETDLGAVIQDNHSQVDVEMLAEAADVDNLYEEALHNLKNRKSAPAKVTGLSHAEKEQAAKDYYANVRTNLLLVWVLSNGILLVGILGGGQPSDTFSQNGEISRTKVYMTFILAFSAISNLTRFCGSTLFFLTRFITG